MKRIVWYFTLSWIISRTNYRILKSYLTDAGHRIFLGKTFILTSANRQTSDGYVFKKNEMKKHIQERGGIVVDDLAVSLRSSSGVR